MSSTPVTVRSVLGILTRERLFDLARVFGFRVRPTCEDKRKIIASLGQGVGA